MVKAIINVTVAIPLMLVLIGCTATNKGEINSYVEVACDPGRIKQVAVFSIQNASFEPSASLPVNKSILTSMSPHINKTIINAITSKNPEITVISPSASLTKINSSGMARQWGEFVDDYYNSGKINKEILYKVSNSLGVDAVLLGQLIRVYQSDGNEWDTTGTTIVTVIFSILEVSTAMTIWEVTADGIVKRQMEKAAPPVGEAIDSAINIVTENVPIL